MSEGKRRKRPPIRMQNVLIFLLLAIFAICAIFLTALSARVYHDTVNLSGRNNTARTVAAIIRGAAQGEDAGNVSVRTENGIPTLVFADEYDGEIYLRRLFCAEGYLMESLVSEDQEFDPEMGETLVEISSFDAELKDGLLTARVLLPDGSEETVNVFLRAGGAAE